MTAPHYTIGVDWGKGTSETCYLRFDAATQQYVGITEAEAKELDRAGRERQRWGKMLMVDYKVGTTNGAQRMRWLREQRHLQTGKI